MIVVPSTESPSGTNSFTPSNPSAIFPKLLSPLLFCTVNTQSVSISSFSNQHCEPLSVTFEPLFRQIPSFVIQLISSVMNFTFDKVSIALVNPTLAFVIPQFNVPFFTYNE